MTISEKVAYLKGLADGMELDKETSKESKLIAKIIDVLEEVGLSIEDLEQETEELGEELDAVSDDLADVEELLLEEEDELDGGCGCDCQDEDDICGCSCGCGEDADDFFEVACPNCNEALVIDEKVLDSGGVECANCGQKFSLDLEDDAETEE